MSILLYPFLHLKMEADPASENNGVLNIQGSRSSYRLMIFVMGPYVSYNIVPVLKNLLALIRKRQWFNHLSCNMSSIKLKLLTFCKISGSGTGSTQPREYN
jgi:hypothetical protein